MIKSIHHEKGKMDTFDTSRKLVLSQQTTLRAYRAAVGRRTRHVVTPLTPAQLKQRVDSTRLQRVRDEGAVAPAASGIVDYWGGRTAAGLLLMPASRHLITHLNEALDVKRRTSPAA